MVGRSGGLWSASLAGMTRAARTRSSCRTGSHHPVQHRASAQGHGRAGLGWGDCGEVCCMRSVEPMELWWRWRWRAGAYGKILMPRDLQSF